MGYRMWRLLRLYGSNALNMAQARRACDECVFMLLGEVIEHRSTEDLFSNPHNPKTAEYIEGRFG